MSEHHPAQRHAPRDDTEPARSDGVLVVEDSRALRSVLCELLDAKQHIRTFGVGSYAEAEAALAEDPDRYFCAVLDLNLPDAPRGEVVDLVRGYDIPVVVLTGTVDNAVREAMAAKRVVDYVVKGSATEVEHVAHVVGRLYQNQHVKVLVVDDSRSFREYVRDLLELYRFPVLTAGNGREALEVIREEGDVALVLTDFYMPEMGGLELVQAIRREHRRADVAVIGVSEAGTRGMSALLLKSGANDFLTKPFSVEEFYCRVIQNTNLIGYVRQLREASSRDFLTGVYNRRHLFEAGASLHASARRGRLLLAAAVLDVDHFKAVNDTWGHHVGDEVLKSIARALEEVMGPSDLLARFGGEEFAILRVLGRDGDEAAFFEDMRGRLEALDYRANGVRIPVTASIGFTRDLGESLDAMLQYADRALYTAKISGRNRVDRGGRAMSRRPGGGAGRTTTP